MLLLAIDGACRRNGKPDCVSASGVFIQDIVDNKTISTHCLSNYEINSTSQRGELNALSEALTYIIASGQEAQIITDSEYLFNALNNEWFTRWNHTGWVTANGDPVKNQDLWVNIASDYMAYKDKISIYHIKGHVIPFGKVTANSLLAGDSSGGRLLTFVDAKYASEAKTTKFLFDKAPHAQELSVKNNGFKLNDELLRRFVCANVVADALATHVVDIADAAKND